MSDHEDPAAVDTGVRLRAGDSRASRAQGANAGPRRRHAARPLPRRRPAREPPALQERGAGPDRGDARRRAGGRASSERLPWPGEETVENVDDASVPRAPRSTRRSGPVARATSTGATDRSVASTVTPDERLRRYAELAVRVGANVQPGQDVVVTCLVEHAEIARAMAREAYRAGAQHVVVLYSDLHVRRAAIELGPEEELGWSPPYLLDWMRRWTDGEPGAHLADRAIPDPDLLADLDPALVGRADPREIRVALLESIPARRVNWVDRRGAERGLGDAGVRRAGRRAALGCGRDGHAARRARSGRRLAGARGSGSRRGPTR